MHFLPWYAGLSGSSHLPLASFPATSTAIKYVLESKYLRCSKSSCCRIAYWSSVWIFGFNLLCSELVSSTLQFHGLRSYSSFSDLRVKEHVHSMFSVVCPHLNEISFPIIFTWLLLVHQNEVKFLALSSTLPLPLLCVPCLDLRVLLLAH